jgi:hypothetical protein
VSLVAVPVSDIHPPERVDASLPPVHAAVAVSSPKRRESDVAASSPESSVAASSSHLDSSVAASSLPRTRESSVSAPSSDLDSSVRASSFPQPRQSSERAAPQSSRSLPHRTRTKSIAAGALGALAVVLVAWLFVSDKPPAEAPRRPLVAAIPVSVHSAQVSVAQAAPSFESPPEPSAVEPTKPSPRPADLTKQPRNVKTGQLSLRSRSAWVEVYLDGRLLGTTPLNRLTVPSGALNLRLVNAAAGIDKTIGIVVAPGEHVRQTVE